MIAKSQEFFLSFQLSLYIILLPGRGTAGQLKETAFFALFSSCFESCFVVVLSYKKIKVHMATKAFDMRIVEPSFEVKGMFILAKPRCFF